MPHRLAAIAIQAALIAPAGPGLAAARDTPVELAPDLAKLLSAAQAALKANRPQQAIDRLRAYRGDDHAFRHLLLGHAYLRQSKLPEAAAAYERALAMAPALRQAGICLAQVHARQGRRRKAAELLGRFVEIDSCPADLLLLYAQVAGQLHDERLCGLLVRKGILRFPGDLRFRRMDLVLLLNAADYRQAAQAVLLLLKETPTDPALWERLAFARGRAAAEIDSLSALEAGLLCDPADLARHRQFLSAQLAAGDWLTVIKHGRSLLGGPLGKAASADLGLMEILIRAADMGERDDVLSAWLGWVNDKARTRPMRLAAARLALRRGRTAQAREALRHLIEAGETDPSVFLWAGHLAETANDPAQAETLYTQARKLTGPAARLAVLYLGRLHIRLGRFGQAR